MTLSYPKNNVQKIAQASSWDDAFFQPAIEETFCFPISRLMYAKEVKVLPPKIAYHFCVRSAASNPAKGERSGNVKVFRAYPTPSGSLV